MELIQSFVSLREQRLSDHDEKLLPEGDGQPSTSDDRERSSHFDEVVHKLPEGESPVRLMLKQLILAEGINRNQSHIVLHGHLHETLPVLQVQHIFLFVRPFQDFLDPSDDEAEAISSCQLLLNALSVARDHSVQRHQRRQDWNVEHGVVDPSEEFLVSELREPDVEKTAKQGEPVEQPAMWMPTEDVVFVTCHRRLLQQLERLHISHKVHQRLPETILLEPWGVHFRQGTQDHQRGDEKNAPCNAVRAIEVQGRNQ
mmetsp:Transcript_42220/g.133012  ORF Transcript_42220/g.133012 Transcript_42220/m.133012 type:complete len:257 (+) Transcript_42220:151-921(+)